jgi:hypothetical protein
LTTNLAPALRPVKGSGGVASSHPFELRAILLQLDDRGSSQIKQFGYTLHAKTFVRSPVLPLRPLCNALAPSDALQLTLSCEKRGD